MSQTSPNRCSLRNRAAPLSERIDTTALDVQWSSSQAAKADEALRQHRLLADMVVSASLGDAETSGARRCCVARAGRGGLSDP